MKRLFSVCILIAIAIVFSACNNLPTKFRTGEPKIDSFLDKDAFDLYIGKKINEIKNIAPHFEKLDDNTYMVEYKEDENGSMFIYVNTDKKNIALILGIVLDKQKSTTIGTDPFSLLDFGTEIMGISNHETVSELFTNDKTNRYLSEDILCSVKKRDNEDSTEVFCYETDDTMKSVYYALFNRYNKPNITLVDSSYSGDLLVATFLAENNWHESEKFSCSDFEAKNSKFETLELKCSTLSDCSDSFDDKIITRENKLRSYLCIRQTGDTLIRIFYNTSTESDDASDKPTYFDVFTIPGL